MDNKLQKMTSTGRHLIQEKKLFLHNTALTISEASLKSEWTDKASSSATGKRSVGCDMRLTWKELTCWVQWSPFYLKFHKPNSLMCITCLISYDRLTGCCLLFFFLPLRSSILRSFSIMLCFRSAIVLVCSLTWAFNSPSSSFWWKYQL